MFSLLSCASTKVYVLGIDAKQSISDMKEKDAEKIVLGIIVSGITHIVGHHIAAELVGGDLDQQGLEEVTLNWRKLSNSDHRWISRGGFVAQTLVNTVLTSFEATRDSYFTRGYTLGTMLNMAGYQLTSPSSSGEGDWHYLDEVGGNSDFEWGLFTSIGLYNFYAINKEKGGE